MSTIGPIGKPVIPPVSSPVGVIGLPWAPGGSGRLLPPGAPTISGTVTIGGTLTITPGAGGPTTSYTLYRDGVSAGTVVSGYTYVAADIGPSLTVTATGPGGTSAASNALVYSLVADLGAKLRGYFRGDMGITLSGSNVTTWADQSGNGLDLSQGTAILQPTMTTINGRAAVLFDGSNDVLAGSSLNSYTTRAAYHVISQAKPTTIVGTNAVPYLNDGMAGDASDWWGLYWKKNGANYEALGFQFEASAKAATGTGVTLGAVNAIDWSYNGTNISIQVGAGSVGTTASAQRAGGDALAMEVGSSLVGASHPFNGSLGLLVFCNAVLSAGQQANARAFGTYLYGGAT